MPPAVHAAFHVTAENSTSENISNKETYLFFAAAALSLWRLFLNQFPTCVGVRPVAWASSLFLLGFG